VSAGRINYRCECGQAIAAAPTMAGKRAKCPKCGAVATVPSASAEEAQASQAALDAEPDALVGRLCAVCQTTLAQGEAACICSACRAPYHRECWDEIGGCASYGCEHMPQAPKEDVDEAGRGGAWGDVKECPRCHKEIRSSAVKCRFCKASFPSAVPMSTRDYLDWSKSRKELAPTRQTAIFFFVVGLLGFFAPLVLIAGLIWAIYNRVALARVGGVHQVLVYFAIGLSAIYTLILLLVVLG
jgi:hypothetical protein